MGFKDRRRGRRRNFDNRTVDGQKNKTDQSEQKTGQEQGAETALQVQPQLRDGQEINQQQRPQEGQDQNPGRDDNRTRDDNRGRDDGRSRRQWPDDRKAGRQKEEGRRPEGIPADGQGVATRFDRGPREENHNLGQRRVLKDTRNKPERPPRSSSRAAMSAELPGEVRDPQKSPEFEEPEILDASYGGFGGQYISEKIAGPVHEITTAFIRYGSDRHFCEDFVRAYREMSCRPTPLHHARKLSGRIGAKVYFKKEEIPFTTATALTNALGQALLAKRMGRKFVVTPTCDGISAVAAAMACSHCNLELTVYAGSGDENKVSWIIPLVRRLRTTVIFIGEAAASYVEAHEACLQAMVGGIREAFFLCDTPIGPHPYPHMFKFFTRCISEEIKGQVLEREGKMPTCIVVPGGSGASGVACFTDFIETLSVRLVHVEAAGTGSDRDGAHCCNLSKAITGVALGCKTSFVAGGNGSPGTVSSIAPGLRHPVASPEMAYLRSISRISTSQATDLDAASAFAFVAHTEGILLSPSAAHAVHWVLANANSLKKDDIVVVPIDFPRPADIDDFEALLARETPVHYSFGV